MPATVTKVARRSDEERIQALEAQLEALRQRKARKYQRRDPALKQMHAAVRSIDKALAASSDRATREALGEARNTLTACLALTGSAPRGTPVPQARRMAGDITEDGLLSHVRKNPGHRGEQIAVALGTDTGTVRPV